MYLFYFSTYAQRASTILALLICSYAPWRGGKPERLGSISILIAWFGTPIIQDQANIAHLQLPIFALDAALCVTLFSLAMLTNRFWPLWAASFQLLELLMHIAMWIDHKVHARAYFVGMELWSYMVLLAIGVGTWREASTRRRQSTAQAFPKQAGL